MYGYYSGDNERNDYDNIQQLDTENIDMEVQEKRLSRAPTVDFNHKMLKKKHTSQKEKLKNFLEKLVEIKIQMKS